MSLLRSTVCALAVSLLSAAAPTHPAAPPPPSNVVLLAVDGLDLEETPALLSLRRHGRVFERAYLPHPLSNAARAALFLGRRPEKTGIWAQADERPEGASLLSEAFAHAGYRTVRIGRTV